MPPTPAATPIPGSQSPVSAHFVATSGEAYLLYALLALIALVLLTPIVLHLVDKDVLRIPYITWFLLHYGIAALALLAILILGVSGTISGEVISALVGSLLGYVLGSSNTRPAAANAGQARNPPAGTITGLQPEAGPAAGGATEVTIRGTGFGTQPGSVQFNNTQAEVVGPWADTQLRVRVPAAAPPGQATVYVVPAGSTVRIASPTPFTVQ